MKHMGTLAVACELLDCFQHVGSDSLTRDWTQNPCIGSMEPSFNHWRTRAVPAAIILYLVESLLKELTATAEISASPIANRNSRPVYD